MLKANRRRAPAPLVRVVVVDPDDDMRVLYREWLRHTGWDVIEASDGHDALVKALVRTHSLIITGLRLPGLDGYALCEILRRNRTTASVPIVVVTDEIRATELLRARHAGADVVLTKPASADSVVDTLKEMLTRRIRRDTPG